MSDYAKGFKDGFAAGLEEGKKLNQSQIGWPSPRLDDYVFGSKDKCPKCGITISGVMGYVCSSINCPTFYQASSHGAVGVNDTVSWTVGANGPASGLDNGYAYR